MRRLLPLFSALACFLLWGMLAAQGASASGHEVQGGKAGEKFSALPLEDLDDENQRGFRDAGEGAGDLTTETPSALFADASKPTRREPVRLRDRRAATLVGIVVLLI